MNALTPLPRPEPSEKAAQHMRMLHRLAELGMSLAEMAAEDAAAAEPDPTQATTPPSEPARPRTPRQEHMLAFSRVSRIVVQAVTLHAALEAGRKPAPAAPTPAREPSIRRHFLAPALAEVASRHPEQITVQQAHQALEDRLAAPEHDDDNLSTLFADICADTGLPPDTRPAPETHALFEQLDREDPPDPPD